MDSIRNLFEQVRSFSRQNSQTTEHTTSTTNQNPQINGQPERVIAAPNDHDASPFKNADKDRYFYLLWRA
uniref:Uncharacterized protein n=1 Tax=Corethrella appendiculata TaxID=1370023 RepID=U5ENS0_9DIPT